MQFCRRNYIIWPGYIETELVPIEKVVDVEKVLRDTGGRRTSAVRGIGAPRNDAEAETVPGNRQLQRIGDATGNDDLVEAVLVTDEVRALDPELITSLCSQSLFDVCFIPYYFCTDFRTGGFTAHGTGSQDIKITGGTAGLFGAFGQVR